MKMETLLQSTDENGNQLEFSGITQACERLIEYGHIMGSDTTDEIKANIKYAIKFAIKCYNHTWDYIEYEELPPELFGGKTIEELKRDYYQIINRINEIKTRTDSPNQYKNGYWTGLIMGYEKEMSIIEEILLRVGESLDPVYQIADIIADNNDSIKLTVQIPLHKRMQVGDAVLLNYNFLKDDDYGRVVKINTVTRDIYDKTLKHEPSKNVVN